jgi:uncharacterized protein (TIGR03435 family)
MKTLQMIISLFLSTVAMVQPGQNLEFEVATIKSAGLENRGKVVPNSCRGTDTRPDSRVTIPLGRCIFQDAFLSYLIREAYEEELTVWSPRISDAVTGGASWTNSERFDIEGKAPDASTATGKDLRRMLQSLLADRFKLKLRRESKEVSGYVLVVTKSGSKLRSAKDTNIRPQITGTRSTPTTLTSTGKNASMANLAVSLSGLGIGPVIDKTALPGSYDFTLTFEPDAGMQLKKGDASTVERGSGPSLFTALEEQLGLRLVSQKVSVEYLLIESAERPSAN